MEFLYWLESIRNPILNTLMLIFTEFGNEVLFIAVGLIMFWCVDKKQGYFVLLTCTADPAIPAELDRKMRIDTSVMRSLIVCTDE